MDVDAVSSAINKQEENVANKKSNIVKNVAQYLGYAVPQSTPFLFPSSSSSASTAAPSSSAGAASSSSSTVQNMIVARPDVVKRGKGRPRKQPPTMPMIVDKEGDGQKRASSDNDDNSSKPKKTQRKGEDSSKPKKPQRKGGDSNKPKKPQRKGVDSSFTEKKKPCSHLMMLNSQLILRN